MAATNGINLASENYSRIDVSSTNNNTKAFSIGGYGLFEVEAVGTAGGRFKIDNDVNVTCKGTLTNGSNSYIYAGGLRLGVMDGNTLYNDSRVLVITTLNHIYFNIGISLSNYATRMTINTSGNVCRNI
jgi:hypothetical protein